eukprot:1897147-Alexandrium_andersonii.AAC.1
MKERLRFKQPYAAPSSSKQLDAVSCASSAVGLPPLCVCVGGRTRSCLKLLKADQSCRKRLNS